jgi:hypothetical protein
MYNLCAMYLVVLTLKLDIPFVEFLDKLYYIPSVAFTVLELSEVTHPPNIEINPSKDIRMYD